VSEEAVRLYEKPVWSSSRRPWLVYNEEQLLLFKQVDIVRCMLQQALNCLCFKAVFLQGGDKERVEDKRVHPKLVVAIECSDHRIDNCRQHMGKVSCASVAGCGLI
jgi:hypothetical protein